MHAARNAFLATLFTATLCQLACSQVVGTSGLSASGPSGNLYEIDTQTGACTDVGPTNHPYLTGLALDPRTGTIFGCSEANDLYRLDRVTGAAILVGATGVTGSLQGMAWNTAADTLFGVTSSANELITIDPVTGASTVVGSLGVGPITGLAYGPNAATLYGYVSVSDQLVSIDPATGAATGIGVVGTPNGSLQGLSFDRKSGMLVGPEDTSDQLYRIDPATGAGTAVGPLAGATESLRAVAPAPVEFDNLFAVTPASQHSAVCNVYTMGAATGETTTQLPLGISEMMGLAFDPIANVLYGAAGSYQHGDDSGIHIIDPATGRVDPMPFTYAPGVVASLTFDPTNNMIYGTTLAVYSWNYNDFFGINPTTGWAYVGPLVPESVTGLAFATDTNTVYGYAEATDELVIIDPQTLSSTVVGTVGTGTGSIQGLSFDAASGSLYGTTSSSKELVVIDRATGVGTVVANYDPTLSIFGLAPTPVTNPPATVASLGDACVNLSRAFRFMPNASGGYDVVDAGNAAFNPNIGVLAGATADDQITATGLDLGFAFPFPAASGTAPEQFVRIDPNGRILPDSSGVIVGDYIPEVIDLTTNGYPMVCPFWCDFDVTHPESDGIYWITEPGLARFTWNEVSQFGPLEPGTAITVQCTLFDSGEVLVLLENFSGFNTSQNEDDLIVAVASGAGGANPAELDLSSILNGSMQSSDVPAYEHFAVGEFDLIDTAPELGAIARPVMGWAFTYEITNAPAAATVGLYLIGLDTPPAPVPLSLIGFDTPCSLNVNFIDIQLSVPSSTPGTILPQSIPIPAMANSLVGEKLYVQGVTDGAPFASPMILTNTIVGTISDN